MIKSKVFFRGATDRDSGFLGNNTINQWLAENLDIEVISSNLASNNGAWAYIILYRERKLVGEKP